MKKRILPILAMYAFLVVGSFSMLTSCFENVQIVNETGTVIVEVDDEKGTVTPNKSKGDVGETINLSSSYLLCQVR